MPVLAVSVVVDRSYYSTHARTRVRTQASMHSQGLSGVGGGQQF